jgi:hypothetical protein
MYVSSVLIVCIQRPGPPAGPTPRSSGGGLLEARWGCPHSPRARIQGDLLMFQARGTVQTDGIKHKEAIRRTEVVADLSGLVDLGLESIKPGVELLPERRGRTTRPH